MIKKEDVLNALKEIDNKSEVIIITDNKVYDCIQGIFVDLESGNVTLTIKQTNFVKGLYNKRKKGF